MEIIFIVMNFALVVMTGYLFHSFSSRRLVYTFVAVGLGYLLILPMLMSASYSGLLCYGMILLGLAGIFFIAWLISLVVKGVSLTEKFQYAYLALSFATMGFTSGALGGIIACAIT